MPRARAILPAGQEPGGCRIQKDYLKGLLVAYQGNITRAAAAAQKNRRAFWQLVRKHHLDAKTFKPLPS